MKSTAKNMPLEIVTPEREVFKGEILFGVFPGTEGELGILPGHTHILTSLGAGEPVMGRGTWRFPQVSLRSAEKASPFSQRRPNLPRISIFCAPNARASRPLKVWRAS